MQLPENVDLGEMSGVYFSCALASEKWKRIKNTPYYATIRRNLEHQIALNKNLESQLEYTLSLKEKIRNNLAEEYRKDSLLVKDSVIGSSSVQNSQNNLLVQEEDCASIQNARLTKKAEIINSQTEVAKSYIDEDERVEEAYADMITKQNMLEAEVRLWEEKYLLIAHCAGYVEYGEFWRENSYAQSGKTIFSVIPEKNSVVGEVLIPAIGAGKIKVGQMVNVKMNDYPYEEFGMLRGRVSNVSKMANKVEMSGQVVECYHVTVDFPDGLVTNFGRQLLLNFEAKGTAEIVTTPKSLIARLFDNLKSNTEK